MSLSFLMFVLATIGLTNILVHGAILDHIVVSGRSVRKWLHYWKWSESLFNCYECTGTWSGFICCALLVSTDLATILACGFIGGLLSSWNNLLFEWVNSKIEFVIDTGSLNGEEQTNE